MNHCRATLYIYIKLHVIRRHLLLQRLPAQTHLHQKKEKTTSRHRLGQRQQRDMSLEYVLWKARFPFGLVDRKRRRRHAIGCWDTEHLSLMWRVTSSTTTAPRHLVDRKLMSMLEEKGRQKASIKLKLSSISFIYHHASEFTQSAKGTESASMSSIEMLANYDDQSMAVGVFTCCLPV